MICDLQKASLWKRISAFLFDIIMFVSVVTLVAFLMSSLLKYDKYKKIIDDRKNDYVAKYEVEYEREHGEECKLDLSVAYDDMSEGQKEIYKNVDEALRRDSAVSRTYAMMINLTLVITSVSVLSAHLLLEFVIPLIFKNGQTLGKKIFGLGVMRTNSVKVSPVVLFVRMLLGKYAIETMVPIFLIIMMFFGILGIVGTIVIVGLLILEIVVVCVTRTNSTIHDLISDTVVIDMSSQMIFESEQAMIDYKKKLHEEEVARAEYR